MCECPVCERKVWGRDSEQHARLTYPRHVIEAAQDHVVVAMQEPWYGYPSLNTATRTLEDTQRLPKVLFNHQAMEMLAEHMKIRHEAFFPVFADDA